MCQRIARESNRFLHEGRRPQTRGRAGVVAAARGFRGLAHTRTPHNTVTDSSYTPLLYFRKRNRMPFAVSTRPASRTNNESTRISTDCRNSATRPSVSPASVLRARSVPIRPYKRATSLNVSHGVFSVCYNAAFGGRRRRDLLAPPCTASAAPPQGEMHTGLPRIVGPRIACLMTVQLDSLTFPSKDSVTVGRPVTQSHPAPSTGHLSVR